ncbi:MAG TPA: helix-hairpin-helix domain-containing protein [Actinomycetes bacterium]
MTRPGGSARAALADRVPPVLRSAVVAPAGRAVAGLVLLVSLAVVTALVAVWLARPRAEPVPSRPRLVGAPLATSSAVATPASTASTVLVHVVGAVRRPGVVELPSGSRVADAVDAAGGVSRSGSAASVNLARPAVDGEQVVVARRGDAPVAAAGPAVPGPPTANGSAPVDLNAATLEQLDGLPGIGPVLAQRILDWRTANGRFSAVDELGEVSGIGEATLADLRPVVTV